MKTPPHAMTNDRAPATRRPRPQRRSVSRTGAAIIVAAGLVAVAPACSGGGSSRPSGHASGAEGSASSESTTSQLAFSYCMRSSGVLSFPDPTSSGVIPKETLQQLGVTGSQYQAAEIACAHLLPNGGAGPTPAALQQSWNDMANFARCMRSHGVPNWPDPTRYPQHPDRPTFNLEPVGIDPASPLIGGAIHNCEPLLGANNPQHLGEGGP